MPDIRDVKVGDEIEITLKFKVGEVTNDYVKPHRTSPSSMASKRSVPWLGRDMPFDLYTLKILKKPLAVGDKVRNPSGDLLGEVRMIEGNDVWVKVSNGSHLTYKLKNLKKDTCNCD